MNLLSPREGTIGRVEYFKFLNDTTNDEVKNYDIEKEIPQFYTETKSEIPDSVVVLIGKTGSGKSSFINWFAKKDDVKVSNNMNPCTQGLEMYRVGKVVFYDTPGLMESKEKDEETIMALMNLVKNVEISLVVLCVPVTENFTESYKEAFNIYSQIFQCCQTKIRLAISQVRNPPDLKRIRALYNYISDLFTIGGEVYAFDKPNMGDSSLKKLNDFMHKMFCNELKKLGAEDIKSDVIQLYGENLINVRKFIQKLKETQRKVESTLNSESEFSQLLAKKQQLIDWVNKWDSKTLIKVESKVIRKTNNWFTKTFEMEIKLPCHCTQVRLQVQRSFKEFHHELKGDFLYVKWKTCSFKDAWFSYDVYTESQLFYKNQLIIKKNMIQEIENLTKDKVVDFGDDFKKITDVIDSFDQENCTIVVQSYTDIVGSLFDIGVFLAKIGVAVLL